jgi:hypothetical protein
LCKTLPKVAVEMALHVLAYKHDARHKHHAHKATAAAIRG